MYFEQVGSASPLNRSTHTHELYLLFNRTNTTNGALSADQAAVRDLLHACAYTTPRAGVYCNLSVARDALSI